MAGENRKINYVIGADGAKYRVVLEPVDATRLAKPVNKQRFSKKTLLLLLIPALLVASLVAAQFIYRRQHEPESALPKSITASVNFPLYYPQPLPPGYNLSQQPAVDPETKIVSYSFKGEGTIDMYAQSLPTDFDAKSMFKNHPVPEASSPIGPVYDLSANKQKRFMVVTGKTLIFISSNDSFSDDKVFFEIINSLKRT